MFSPADKSTACGMWSPTYIFALALTFALVGLGLFFSRKMTKTAVRRVLIVTAIFSISTEIVKMVFVGLTYGMEKVELTPLYFCSCFMYALVMALCKKPSLRQMGLSFLFYGGIVGALAFFAYPSACIPRYPIYHFMCLRTMLYHGSMIYVGILIVMRGIFTPSANHFHAFAVMIGTIGFAAYAINLLTGENYMSISEPLDIPVVEQIYHAIPNLYPFLGILLQMVAPFWITEGIYRLTHKKQR
jgi:uncharacterized membrane protein YwaF